MSYIEFTDFNKTGLEGLFLYPAEVVPSFIPLILIALFSVTLLATFFSQKRLTGRGDFFSSFAVAGFLTAIIAYFMTLVEGLINIQTLLIAIVIAIIGAILLFIRK